MTALRLRRAALTCLCALLSMEPVALAQGAPASPPRSDKADPAALQAQQDSDFAAKKKEAQAAFETGLTHYEKEEWDAALVEFARSRAAYPTRSATKNAALCLRKLGRLDEAIDMFEALLGFENLPDEDRKATQAAVAELTRTLGTLRIEGALPGASIVVDGRFRGTAPLPAPLRVTEGSHEVRAFKEGQEPYGATAEVTANQETRAALRSLATGGRLRVTEERGRVLDVVVDGAIVGKTPWEGPLSVGPHVVLLRGHGQWVPDCADGPAEGARPGESAAARAAKEVVELGTEPAGVRIQLHELTALTLAAEELDTSLRIDPKPAGAAVEIDSGFVGWGAWEGMLRVGQHKVAVSAEGFTSVTRTVSLSRHQRQVISFDLPLAPKPPVPLAERRNALATAAFGLGAAGLGALIAGSVLATDKNHDLERVCPNKDCPLDKQGDLDDLRAFETIANVGIAVAAIGAAAGITLLLTLHPKPADGPAGAAPAAARPAWTLGLGPGRFQLGASF